MPDFLRYKYREIVNLYRILFHAVVVFGPEHDFLFKSTSTYYDLSTYVIFFAIKNFLYRYLFFVSTYKGIKKITFCRISTWVLYILIVHTKGQFISKCLFGVFNFPKK